MNQEVRALEPSALWNHFSDLNAVPRPSKKEERVIAFMKKFGEELGLETYVDEVGNVIIKKPASPGMEDRPVVALQSHLDMVHQKNADTIFNFDEQGIEMIVKDDWVCANGTTLGADNGIGVASIMAVLAAKDMVHPPVEALFTIDEETGMTGALELKGGLLSAKYMLNLDTEDDHELTIGCAGGVDVTGLGQYIEEDASEGLKAFRILIKGLTGGHSGMDIHKGRGNANKLMTRLLLKASRQFGLRLVSIDGGGLRNAIPRESVAIVALPEAEASAFQALLEEFQEIVKAEYQTTDSELAVICETAEAPSKVLSGDFQAQLLRALQTLPNGIYRMSPDIKDLVQTSNNLARVLVKDGEFKVLCLTRSSVDTEKWDEAEAIRSALELAGAEVEFSGTYPGWTPQPESDLVHLMSDLYEKRFGKSADVNACHAGLECGILGTNYPEMEMISFGPNIRAAHSPDEKVQISSVQKFWGFLVDTLGKL